MAILETLLEVLQALSSVFAVVVATLAFWHTREVSKVRGPEFVIPAVWLEKLWEAHFTVHALIQNIGD